MTPFIVLKRMVGPPGWKKFKVYLHQRKAIGGCESESFISYVHHLTWEVPFNSPIHKAAGLTGPGRSMILPGTIPETPISREWSRRLERPLGVVPTAGRTPTGGFVNRAVNEGDPFHVRFCLSLIHRRWKRRHDHFSLQYKKIAGIHSWH